MFQSAMPAPFPVLVPEVLPAVMPDLPAVPDFLPAPPPELVLPSRLPADLPAEGRAALAAALEGPLPAGRRPERGELVRGSVPACWDDAERLPAYVDCVDNLCDRAIPSDGDIAVEVAMLGNQVGRLVGTCGPNSRNAQLAT